MSWVARTTWARALGAANCPRGASGALRCFQRLWMPRTGGATPNFDILDAQRALHPPQLPGTPTHRGNPLGKPRQDRQCARSGEDSLLCPGMRRALQPRPPPSQLPRGAEAAGATLRPGSLPVSARVRTAAERSAETQSSHSRNRPRSFLLQEVAE